MISQKSMYVITQSDLGGAQKYVFDHAQADVKNNIKTIIVSDNKKGWLYQQAQKNNIEYLAINNFVRDINIINDFFSLIKLIIIVFNEKPTHLFLNSSKISLIGVLAGKICKVKNIIYTVHGWVFNEPMSSIRKKAYIFVEKISALWKNKIIFINNYDLEIAKNYSIGKKEQYVLSKLEIEPIKFLDKNEAKKILSTIAKKDLNDKKIVGTIANFFTTKNLSALIDIANELQSNQELFFIIIGDGPEKNNLYHKIKQLDLNNICLLGQIENAASYLKAFDLFVLTSVKEGSPYVLLEAKQANIPILATPVGGVPEMLNKEQICLISEMKDKIKMIVK